jgi:hypothetical protein
MKFDAKILEALGITLGAGHDGVTSVRKNRTQMA